jgi:chemotaxis protein CheD
MNHFLLPSRSKSASDDTDVILAGDYSMEVLLNTMLSKGAAKQRIIAKAFGGGTIVTSILMAIGQRNAEFAQEWLEREGIPLAAQDFGGAWSRKVLFTPDTGDAYLPQAADQPAGCAEGGQRRARLRAVADQAQPAKRRKEDRTVLRPTTMNTSAFTPPALPGPAQAMDVTPSWPACRRARKATNLVFPTTAELALKVQRLIDDPDCSIDSLAKLVQADPLLAARVVAVANSVIYNRSGRASRRCPQCRLPARLNTLRVLAAARSW